MKAAALALFAAVCQAKEIWYDVTYVDDVNPTGQFSRRAVGVNGTWPPPPISAFNNETLTVHVTNKLDTPTTIHHHGMYFYNTTYYDGAVMVSQCGIPANQSFTYEVPLQGQDPGTYWYHSHVEGQYVDGLRAPFIVHPSTTEAHAYDEDITVVLGDWYKDQHADLMKDFLALSNPTGAEPVPETLLMYLAQNDTYLPGFTDNATLNFVPGRTYRLRVINTAAFSMFHFWIDGHQMRVIEIDGVDTEEYQADWISLGVAQRFSVLVTALDTADANYYMHADFNPDMFDVIPDDLRLNYTLPVVYTSGASFAEEGLLPEYALFPDDELVPVVAQAPETPDVVHNLVVYFETYADGTNRGTFNHTVYTIPKTPTVLTTMSMGELAAGTQVYGVENNNLILDYNHVVEVNIFNTDGGMHPFHLHGHKFQIIGRNDTWDLDDQNLGTSYAASPSNPARRDTIQVPGEGYVTIRFKADNPGSWLFHCHIEWHLESGLALTFHEAPIQAQQWLQIPTELTDQCTALGVSTTGNIAGINSATDFGDLKFGPYPQNNGWKGKGIAAMTMCVFTVILGLLSIAWYSTGGGITEEEHFEEVQIAEEAKAQAKADKAANGSQGFLSKFRR